MKPSERIQKIAIEKWESESNSKRRAKLTEGSFMNEDQPRINDWVEAILEYLDEQSTEEGQK